MVIDIIIVIVIIGLAFIGRQRGLVRCLVNIISFVLSTVLAVSWYKPVGTFLIQHTLIDENIKTSIKNTVQVQDIQLSYDNKLPAILEDYISQATKSINDTKDAINETISSNITIHIVYGIAYLVIFLITQIIIFILKILSRFMEYLPVLDKFNEWGGTILGLFEGVVVVYTTLAIISVLAPMMQNTKIIGQINKSYVGKYIYNNNILGNM